jgi:hypothetical protein
VIEVELTDREARALIFAHQISADLLARHGVGPAEPTGESVGEQAVFKLELALVSAQEPVS